MRFGRSKNSILTILQSFEFSVHQLPVVPATLQSTPKPTAHLGNHKAERHKFRRAEHGLDITRTTLNPRQNAALHHLACLKSHRPEMTGSPILKLTSMLQSLKHL